MPKTIPYLPKESDFFSITFGQEKKQISNNNEIKIIKKNKNINKYKLWRESEEFGQP